MGQNKYPKFAPILYAAQESDGCCIDDQMKVFMNPQIVLVSLTYLYAGLLTHYQALKGLLTGAASITRSANMRSLKHVPPCGGFLV